MVELTGTEQLIMRCIWDLGENVGVAELRNRLKDQYGKDYARTTISVFMSYLRDKGYVAYEKRGHAYFYSPRVTEEEYQRILIERYQKDIFSKSTVDFIRIFLDGKALTKQECESIRALIDKKERECV